MSGDATLVQDEDDDNSVSSILEFEPVQTLSNHDYLGVVKKRYLKMLIRNMILMQSVR